MLIPLHTFGLGGRVSTLSASLSGSSASASGTGGGPFTTNSITVTASGGTAPYTYSWTKVSGDTMTISSSTAATVSWTDSGTAPSSLNSVWKCTVTDSASRTVDSANVSVSISFNLSALTAGLSTSSLSASQTGDGSLTTGSVTANPSGGLAPYTYSWTYVSGDGTIAVSSATAQTVTFSRTGTAGNTYSAVWQCVVTDSNSSSVNAGTVSISFTFSVPALSVSLSNGSASATQVGTGTATTTPTVTATASGGTGGYTYSWTYVSGDSSIYPVSPTSAATDFARFGSPEFSYTAYYKCVVTDSSSNTASSSDVTVIIDFVY